MTFLAILIQRTLSETMGVQLSLSLKTLEKLYRCIKQLGGVTVIRRNSTLKNIDCIQTDGRFREVLGELGKLLQQFFVPFKKFPEIQLYGFSPHYHFLHGRVCADPEMINQSFEITSGCDVSLNGTYRINKDVTYWINITVGHVSYAAARCNHFHLAPNCNIGVLNSSHVTMKNNFAVEVVINKENKSYTPEQYLPLLEGLGICLGNDKYAKKDPAWLKQFYKFENIISLNLLSISVILELLLLIVYLAWKRTRNIPEKNLIAFCFVLLVCDIIGLMLPLTKNSLDEISCKTIAVLLHFFSLALCTWSGIIAYDIWFIFWSRSAAQRPDIFFLQYSLVAWGVPTVLTVICLTVDILWGENH